jgi:hypothetical protein
MCSDKFQTRIRRNRSIGESDGKVTDSITHVLCTLCGKSISFSSNSICFRFSTQVDLLSFSMEWFCWLLKTGALLSYAQKKSAMAEAAIIWCSSNRCYKILSLDRTGFIQRQSTQVFLLMTLSLGCVVIDIWFFAYEFSRRTNPFSNVVYKPVSI